MRYLAQDSLPSADGPRGSPAELAPVYISVMDGVGTMTETETERFEERAAIVEFEAGWPRPVAEAEARRIIGAWRWFSALSPSRPSDTAAGQFNPVSRRSGVTGPTSTRRGCQT